MRSLLIAGIFVHAEVSCLHARRAGPAARAYPLSYLLGPSLSLFCCGSGRSRGRPSLLQRHNKRTPCIVFCAYVSKIKAAMGAPGRAVWAGLAMLRRCKNPPHQKRGAERS
uniref:Putative secreted protein n=1 Tax=Anopheles triannulatus TaxID=58253 RepID=A0A2M4B5A7_9DIPT